jgi:hypothetical protein
MQAKMMTMRTTFLVRELLMATMSLPERGFVPQELSRPYAKAC